MNNFLHKPFGILTVLGLAVGTPYAAFETDIGTQVRRSLMGGQLASTQSTNPGDPYSLVAANNATNYGSGWDNSSGQISAYGNQSYNNSFNANNYSGAGLNTSNNYGSSNAPAWSTNPGSAVASPSYGPATIQPLGPPMVSMSGAPNGVVSYGSNGAVEQPRPYIEHRAGPSNLVPGGTQQLWDYTLGTPTLQQLQQQAGSNVAGGQVHDLREVLRFDISPGWLPQRFARVTTVTSNVQMDGLRVPLITGTQPHDIAGTLTYYFDASQSLKRIDLHGLTGDPSALANLMVGYYQLKPEQSLGGQLFTTRWNNRVTSVMQISPAPILYAGADHSKYIIFLELNQPSNQYGLSEEASEILRNSQALQRW